MSKNKHKSNHQKNYYFEFIPSMIYFKQKSKILYENTENIFYKFALYQHFSSDQKLQQHKVLQNKIWLPVIFDLGKLQCEFSSLNFLINQKINQKSKYSYQVKLFFKKMIQGQNDTRQEIDQYQKQVNKIGTLTIDINRYIQLFKKELKTCFYETIQLSQTYSLDFEIYTQRSRLNLQKLIRKMKGSNIQSRLMSANHLRFIEFSQNKNRGSYINQNHFYKNTRTVSIGKKNHINNNRRVIQEPIRNLNKLFSEYSTNIFLSKLQKQVSTNIFQYINSAKSAQKQQYLDKTQEQRQLKVINVNLDKSFVTPHFQMDLSFAENNKQLNHFKNKFFLIIFWFFSILMLYITIIPTKKV